IASRWKIDIGVEEVTAAPAANWVKPGDRLLLADALAAEVMQQARVTAFSKVHPVPAADLAALVCAHPLRGFAGGYQFKVPLLAGEHVTADAGTGFVHTAPGHGRDDFEIWTAHRAELEARGINAAIPYAVDENGA